jgi:sugar (pentulose or hexulose) kinase
MAVLGVDVGTTAVKAMLVDNETGSRHLSQCGVGISTPRPGWVEQDPEDYWTAIGLAVGDVLSRLGAGIDVSSLSISTQGGTLIPIDASGHVLGRAVVWMDHRAVTQSKALLRELGPDFFYLKTGWRPSGCLPFLQICWLREERPDLFERIDRFAFVGDYLAERLSGEWACDPTNAGMTMLYSLERGEWDPELLELAGISADMLPPLRSTGDELGTLRPSSAEDLGLSENTLVVNGGHDQYCASLGAGATGQGDLLISGGTAWVLLATCSSPRFDTSSYLSPGRHIMEGGWGLLSSIPAAGAGLNWFRKMAGGGRDEREFYRRIEATAAEIPPGSDGVLFHPYFTGSTIPAWEPNLRGAILGIGLGQDIGHLFRAYLEGVAFECRLNTEAFARVGVKLRGAVMIGGAARSGIWRRIVCDVLRMPMRIPEEHEAACLGAAILAAKGEGLYGDFREGADALVRTRDRVDPGPGADHYDRSFEAYLRSVEALRRLRAP